MQDAALGKLARGLPKLQEITVAGKDVCISCRTIEEFNTGLGAPTDPGATQIEAKGEAPRRGRRGCEGQGGDIGRGINRDIGHADDRESGTTARHGTPPA